MGPTASFQSAVTPIARSGVAHPALAGGAPSATSCSTRAASGGGLSQLSSALSSAELASNAATGSVAETSQRSCFGRACCKGETTPPVPRGQGSAPSPAGGAASVGTHRSRASAVNSASALAAIAPLVPSRGWDAPPPAPPRSSDPARASRYPTSAFARACAREPALASPLSASAASASMAFAASRTPSTGSLVLSPRETSASHAAGKPSRPAG
mmetsp:Transcript_22152/g.51510  ORF Transcript_22152/g.51510 Transcript_22152/m.51510 type:complete len:214 (+) Transcript_22152:1778-2419(+)